MARSSKKNSPIPDGVILFFYNSKDKLSVLKYASFLSGHRLNEFTDSDSPITSQHTKGDYGKLIEKVYFGYNPNNRPEADFLEIGVELKTTQLELKKTLGWDPTERLILNIINYMEVGEGSFDDVFTRKNSELLLVFYRKNKGEKVLDRLIDKVVFWTFTPQEIEVMKEDWKKAEDMILSGKAHELHEGGTYILTWAPKGEGHDGDMRPQPFSTTLARQRALALNGAYVKKMYRQSLDLKDAIEQQIPCRLWGAPDVQNIFDELWPEDESFEDAILSKLSPCYGKTCDEIEDPSWNLNRGSKGYYALLANRMLGVKTTYAAEIEDYSFIVKIVRVKRNRKSKESMSFPAFDYVDLSKQKWETSDFKEIIDSRFLLIVFQMTDDDDKNIGQAICRGAFFWTIPEDDKEEIKFVWEDTVSQIKKNIYDDFQELSNTFVTHVRPHAEDGGDTSTGLDGNEYGKKCFWLNADYITEIVNKNLNIPLLSSRVRNIPKIGKRRILIDKK